MRGAQTWASNGPCHPLGSSQHPDTSASWGRGSQDADTCWLGGGSEGSTDEGIPFCALRVRRWRREGSAAKRWVTPPSWVA